MSRTLVTLRCAVPSDAPILVELWSDVLRRADHREQLSDVLEIIGRADDDDQRLVVAEFDGHVAGAVHLWVTTMSQLNLEPTVQALSPHVLPQYRRHGVGRALMEAAVGFAEERGIGHIATAAVASSRDANRFMARLALGPQAVLRVAATHAVRARLASRRPAGQRGNPRQLTQVLAARRSLRRAQSSTSLPG